MDNTGSANLVVQLLQDATIDAAPAPQWYEQLKAAVNDLINHDFDALLQLLYRVDVSEAKLRSLLQQSPDQDAAAIIANLLLERHLQKIKSRRESQQRDESIPEDERW